MMMQVEAFEVPETAQRVRIVREGGLDASCFIQANSWHPGCEVAWKNWTQFATGVNLRNASIACIMDDTLPWHRALALKETTAQDYVDLSACSEGLWVGFRLQLRRTRNAACFRSHRYWVCWKPSAEPPVPIDSIYDVRFLVLQPFGSKAPEPEDVPPTKLASLLCSRDVSGL